MVLSGSAAMSAESFYRYFQVESQEIQHQIEEISDIAINAASRKSIADTCLARITRLAAEVADAAGDIPSYSQKSYNETIKSLQDKLAQTQALHAPKSKFSFKSKRSTPTPPIAGDGQRAIHDHITSSLGLNIDSVSSSRSVTPVHLQTPDRERTGNTPVPIDPLPTFHTADGLHINDNEEHGDLKVTRETDRHTFGSENSSGQPEATLNITNHTGNVIISTPQTSTSLSICTVSNLASSYLLMPAASKSFASLTLTGSTTSLFSFLAPVDGSAHITGLYNSIILLHCRQFRMHHCENVDVFLFCSSRPIIEGCHGIRFAKLPRSALELIDAANTDTGTTNASKNMFDQVDDFKWLRAEPSPNWSLMQSGDELEEDIWRDVLQLEPDGKSEAEEVLRKVKLK